MGQGNKQLRLPPDKAAPQSLSLTESFKGIAMVKPPLEMETTAQDLKEKELLKETPSENAWTQDPYNRSPGQTRQEVPKVSMVEVPNKEDDTSFHRWKKANLKPPVAPEVT